MFLFMIISLIETKTFNASVSNFIMLQSDKKRRWLAPEVLSGEICTFASDMLVFILLNKHMDCIELNLKLH